jgi:hypothetical protein
MHRSSSTAKAKLPRRWGEPWKLGPISPPAWHTPRPVRRATTSEHPVQMQTKLSRRLHYCPPYLCVSSHTLPPPSCGPSILLAHRSPPAVPSMAKPVPAPSTPAASPIPNFYRLVFLYIEPVSTLLGAIHAHYLQPKYLSLTHATSCPDVIPLGTSIVLSQLANLYLLLCINEALVLRATKDLKVWRTFILGLLIADLGHLYSVRLVGSWVYYEFWNWNAIDWGNVPFVYWLAVVRCFFLAGVGFERDHVRLKGT